MKCKWNNLNDRKYSKSLMKLNYRKWELKRCEGTLPDRAIEWDSMHLFFAEQWVLWLYFKRITHVRDFMSEVSLFLLLDWRWQVDKSVQYVRCLWRGLLQIVLGTAIQKYIAHVGSLLYDMSDNTCHYWDVLLSWFYTLVFCFSFFTWGSCSLQGLFNLSDVITQYC